MPTTVSREPQSSGQAEAGPSGSPLVPSVTHDEPTSDAVESSLSWRRRKNSIFGSLRSNKPSKPRRAQADEDCDSDVDREEEDRLDRTATLEAERLREVFREEIGMIEDETAVKLDGMWFNKPIVYLDAKPGYVWDVLFENQRGIHLLGKAYFSSRTLLPADPSPYTLPSRSIPSASSFTVAQPAPQSSDALRTHTHTQNTSTSSTVQGKRAITTAYTLETYQTPSPAWTWITPWMVNMKNGTDESGWSYNVWFRKGGWRSHAGPMSANGYVRRREWVRLRCLRSDASTGPTGPEGEEVPQPRVEVRPVLEDLKQAWGQSSDLRQVVRVLSAVQLDRIKLEEMEGWLRSMTDEQSEGRRDALQKLRRVLEDETELRRLAQCFTHPSAVPQLLKLLDQYGVQPPYSSHLLPGYDIPARRPSAQSSPDSSPSQESTPQTPTFMSPSSPHSPHSSQSPRASQREKPAAFATPEIGD